MMRRRRIFGHYKQCCRRKFITIVWLLPRESEVSACNEMVRMLTMIVGRVSAGCRQACTNFDVCKSVHVLVCT
jgi:hypothetical protein